MKTIFFFFLILFSFYSSSQDRAQAYFSLIQKAEKKISDRDLDSALFFYETAFDQFDTPFIRELFQATVVASYRDTKDKFYELLVKCIERGMNRYELSFFHPKFKGDTAFNQIQSNFDMYHTHYLNSIDTPVYDVFENIDRMDQLSTKYAMKSNQILDKTVRNFYANSQLYMQSVLSVGWPTENRVGIGNIIISGVVKKNKIHKLPSVQFDNIAVNHYDSILCKDTLEHYVLISDKSVNTSILYQNSRKGNGFLWHHLEQLDSTLNNFVIAGMLDLKIHPLFVAQGIERSETVENDCLLGMGSRYYQSQLHYNKALKYELESSISSRFNSNRANYFIRSLEEEKALLKALFYFEYGKSTFSIPNSFFKKKLRLIELFTNANVG
jgi:hypothetical protein